MATTATTDAAIDDDTLMPLAQWANHPRLPRVRGGRPPQRAALYRWASIGCRGIRLRTVQAGGCRVCCYRDLMDFFSRLGQATGCYSGGDDQLGEMPRTAASRERAASAAERELAAMGVG